MQVVEKEGEENKNDDEGIEDYLFNNEELEEYNDVMGGEESDGGGNNNNNDDSINYEEESLDFEKFLYRYTHPHVLKCFILMLGEYTKNSDCKEII